MKHPTVTAMNRTALALSLLLCAVPAVTAQNDAQKPAISAVIINISNREYYLCYYKNFKPDDVPQEVYDALWEIQKEVVDNFTYDYDVLYRRKKHQHLTTKEDFYTYGKGVCENYADFFILLAREKGLTENLYKVSGRGKPGGHAWLEYRTAENTYIIDPTWSDDYDYKGQNTKKKYRESPAYGKAAFFITYEEDKVIFRSQGYNHSSFPRGRTEVPLWGEAEEE
jgi:hypothetical protein